MSIDRTLHIASGVSSARNVLKRSERIAKMKEDGTFEDETNSPLGLPKTRVKSVRKAPKAAKAEPEAEETTEE